MLVQDYRHFDLLIINDGSSDGSTLLLKNLNDARIVTLHQQNCGVSYTRNVALNYCLHNNYDAIALLDGDDYWEPNHLSNLVALAEKFMNCEVFSSNYTIHGLRKIVPRFSNLTNETDQVLAHFFKHNLWNSTLNCSNMLIKRSAIKTVGFFNEQITHYEDIDWFIRIGIHLKTAFSQTYTVHIDQLAGNRSSSVNYAARSLPEFCEYQGYEPFIPGLEKYIDLNNFSIAINYKMSGQLEQALHYKSKIKVTNLSTKQRFLLALTGKQLTMLYSLKKRLQLLGLDLRTH